MSQGLLGQVRAITTGTAVSLYTPGTGIEASNLVITVCNQTGSAATYDIYHDEDGTASTEVEALYFGVSLAANTTIRIPIGPMNASASNIMVDVGTTNAITFTLNGTERKVT